MIYNNAWVNVPDCLPYMLDIQNRTIYSSSNLNGGLHVDGVNGVRRHAWLGALHNCAAEIKSLVEPRGLLCIRGKALCMHGGVCMCVCLR